jgi:histidine triad (HIT) family protein
MEGCIFCKIANHEIPAKIVLENETIIGFRDINPAAPTHILFIPKRHFKNINDLNDTKLLAEIINAARETAKKEGIDKSGYRLVINNGGDAGQEIQHLHLHLIGGKKLGKMA